MAELLGERGRFLLRAARVVVCVGLRVGQKPAALFLCLLQPLRAQLRRLVFGALPDGGAAVGGVFEDLFRLLLGVANRVQRIFSQGITSVSACRRPI